MNTVLHIYFWDSICFDISSSCYWIFLFCVFQV